MNYKLKTNHHARPIIQVMWDINGGWVEANDFIIQDNRSVDGFWYRGELYAIEEFQLAPDDVKALGFDGVLTESAFSAVVVQWFDTEGNYIGQENVIVGCLTW